MKNRKRPHVVSDAEHDGVDEADSCHGHQTQEEEVGVPVQLEIGGFGGKGWSAPAAP